MNAPEQQHSGWIEHHGKAPNLLCGTKIYLRPITGYKVPNGAVPIKDLVPAWWEHYTDAYRLAPAERPKEDAPARRAERWVPTSERLPCEARAYKVQAHGAITWCWFYPDSGKWAHYFAGQDDNKMACEQEQRAIGYCCHDGYSVQAWLDPSAAGDAVEHALVRTSGGLPWYSRSAGAWVPAMHCKCGNPECKGYSDATGNGARENAAGKGQQSPRACEPNKSLREPHKDGGTASHPSPVSPTTDRGRPVEKYKSLAMKKAEAWRKVIEDRRDFYMRFGRGGRL